MKQLKVKKVGYSEKGELQFPEATHHIDTDNWNYNVDVKAQFGLAYDANHLYLRYVVNEAHPKATSTVINGPVWEDSCVEFFISFDGETYYNLEFNCIGNRVVGYGNIKPKRQRLDQARIIEITTTPSLGRDVIDVKDTPTEWHINITIPKQVFAEASPCFEKGQVYNANFYKCGDKQKEPHYLSWNAINSEKPNFHLPACFGRIIFE